jgi:hypothetical protein
MRGIGNHVYVCGMGRQIYRREKQAYWVKFELGMPEVSHEFSVSGLNSIDGWTEDDMYAVGYNGEIWRCVKGKWTEVASPTNLILHRVRVVDRKLVIACGQKGVLLVGEGDSFRTLEHDETPDNFWGMEWFKGQLYLASDDSIYRVVQAERIEKLDIGKIKTCGHLHTSDGVMWSFGTKNLAWTEDGDTWHDVTP